MWIHLFIAGLGGLGTNTIHSLRPVRPRAQPAATTSPGSIGVDVGVSDAWEFDPLEHKSNGRRPKLLKTGSDYVPAETLAAGSNKFEKVKNAKDGTAAWTEIHELSAKLRSGECTWDELDLDDVNLRLKWAGFFHRGKHAPKTFMVRLKVPNGIVTSQQARVCANLVEPYGDQLGVLDITTRQNLQLRGVSLEDASGVVDALLECGLGSYMSGLDNVRNLVGNPLAGIDPAEIVDTRQICSDINSAITGQFRGNPEWANLPRKFNIAVSGSRDE
jgi:ferredoxin-nitrite reductase